MKHTATTLNLEAILRAKAVMDQAEAECQPADWPSAMMPLPQMITLSREPAGWGAPSNRHERRAAAAKERRGG